MANTLYDFARQRFLEAQIAATDRHNQELEAERKRFAAAQKTRGRQRALAQGVSNAIRKDTDLSCEFRPTHRLRLDDLYRAYGYDPGGTPSGVPSAVSDAAEPRTTP